MTHLEIEKTITLKKKKKALMTTETSRAKNKSITVTLHCFQTSITMLNDKITVTALLIRLQKR